MFFTEKNKVCKVKQLYWIKTLPKV